MSQLMSEAMTGATSAATIVSRRGFLLAASSLAAAAGQLGAQQAPGTSMSGEGYIPVERPAKPGAPPSMSPDDRDALERRIACPCPCTLDIFTCRTSMPSCSFSPQIHRDVNRLVEGGYGGDEIIAAFQDTYGEHILMAPPKRGFNLVGWVMPFAAIGTGALVIVAMLRSWRRPAAAAERVTPLGVNATDDELARLEAAVRSDER